MSSSSTDTQLVDVTMPQMGVSVSEGTIAEWHKQVGDEVAYEETIVSISTDKIDTDLPSPAAGVVQEIVVEVGETVDVGAVIARIATAGGAPTSEEVGGASEAAAAMGETPAPSSGEARAGGEGACRGATRRSCSGSRPSTASTSRRWRGRGAAGACASRTSSRSSRTGRRAADPPLHSESPYRPDPEPAKEGDADAVADAAADRRGHEALARHGGDVHDVGRGRHERGRGGPREARLTALPFVARATIDALREFPALNAWLEGDKYTVHEDVHLGIAVSLGDDGLIVPVIRDAQDLSVEGLSKRIRELARAARDRTLRPDDVDGATFTITNPGQYGSIMATPVINQPQVAILDLEAVVKRVVVVGDDQIAIRPMTILGMSWDHRALDGALAAQFLSAIARRLSAV